MGLAHRGVARVRADGVGVMTNRAGHDGTDFETGVRNYLAEVAGIDVRREVKHGSRDEGDLRATVHGRRTVIECKRVERVTPKMLATYKLQTTVEVANAQADMGVLVMWRKGKGFRYDASLTGSRAKSFGENVAWMTVETLLRLGDARGDVEMATEVAETWVSMALIDVALLMRDWEVAE